MSVRPSTRAPRTCSGARYPAVPMTAPGSVMVSDSDARAMPKSVTFTIFSGAVPSGPSSTLPGFTSRCTMPLACACARAAATCSPMRAASRTGNGPRSRTTCRRLGPSTYSITRNAWSSCSSQSYTLTTFGWFRRAAARASRRKRSRELDAASRLGSLTATSRSRRRSWARCTTPIPPEPTHSPSS